MNVRVSRTAVLAGTVEVPADKSIAHRAALLSALADGTSEIVNYPSSADPQSTLSCLRQLGVGISESEGALRVKGEGLNGLKPPSEPLDCGNSGTTMRLLSGILAGQPFSSVLTGDPSLSRRPMGRIAEPLRAMGARLTLTDGHAPLHIEGGQRLHGIEYHLPVPSAQVKSCVLLAGLFADGETTVVETIPTRDHTERMLGLDVLQIDGQRRLTIEGGHQIRARRWIVPRDFSAAAFFLVAGAIVPEAELSIPGVGINPSRSALLNVLGAMGASIGINNERIYGGEPIADLQVRSSELHGVQIKGSLIPNLIDEIPVLAVAAACARGRTEIRDAAELRVKETDRIAAVVKNLRALGASVEEFDDGLAIDGGKPLHAAPVQSYDDHRIAMSMGVAALVAEGETEILGAECASVSFPEFWEELARLSEQDMDVA